MTFGIWNIFADYKDLLEEITEKFIFLKAFVVSQWQGVGGNWGQILGFNSPGLHRHGLVSHISDGAKIRAKNFRAERGGKKLFGALHDAFEIVFFVLYLRLDMTRNAVIVGMVSHAAQLKIHAGRSSIQWFRICGEESESYRAEIFFLYLLRVKKISSMEFIDDKLQSIGAATKKCLEKIE